MHPSRFGSLIFIRKQVEQALGFNQQYILALGLG
jgi:hypothetical protein